MDLNCTVCLEPFSEQARRPKSLPCGHTLCLWCVQRLPSRQCPQCRQDWAEPAIRDNFYVLDLLDTKNNTKPAGGLWCSDCRTPSSARCLDEHDVRNPRVLLRQCLRDAVPLAKQQLDGLQDGLQDGDALTALRLLRGAPATCKLSLRQDDGEAFGAEWRVEEGSLLQTLVVALAASGRLLQEPPAPVPEPPVPQRIDELDLNDISRTDPGEQPEEKADLLARVRQQGVRRLVNVWCHSDPAWVLDLLRSAAQTLEELSVYYSSEENLRAVHAMPCLQRLELYCLHGALHARPPVLPALSQGGLKWLRAYNLPRATLASLLQAHSATLDVLWLGVGTPGSREFPRNCNDLDALLGQCGLRAARVVLCRVPGCVYDRGACPAQVAAVRRALPGATVRCSRCDGVAAEPF